MRGSGAPDRRCHRYGTGIDAAVQLRQCGARRLLGCEAVVRRIGGVIVIQRIAEPSPFQNALNLGI